MVVAIIMKIRIRKAFIHPTAMERINRLHENDAVKIIMYVFFLYIIKGKKSRITSDYRPVSGV